MSENVANIIEALQKARADWWDLAYDEAPSGELGPPASALEIRRLLDRHRGALPQSYIAFLLLHNGWSRFSGEANLLSTYDRDEDWLEATRQVFARGYKDAPNPFDIYIPIVAGPTPRLAVFFDPATVTEGGEMEVVEFHDGEEVTRHAGFMAFLESRFATYESLIEAEHNGDLPE